MFIDNKGSGPGESARQQDPSQAGSTGQGSADTLPTPAKIPVIATVIRRGDRFLIGKRPRRKRHGGVWEFPGGKVRAGESWLDAARRELCEELAVNVLDVGRVPHRERDGGSDFLIVFVETTINGEPAPREHEALLWASPSEMRGMELAPSDAAFVAAFLGT